MMENWDPKYPYINQLDLAWASGIFDGEGCVHIRRDKPNGSNRTTTYSLIVRVCMTREPTIRKLNHIFGAGRVSFQLKAARTHKHVWVWTVTSYEALYVLQLMYNWLVTKKEQALTAIRFMDLPKAPGTKRVPQQLLKTREKFYWEIRKLNARGEYRLTLEASS